MANHKKLYQYKDQWYDIYQLSEMSGYTIRQLRNRMYQGFSIEQAMREFPMHDSVVEFDLHSNWRDWIGLPSNELYQIYWNWCVKNNMTPVTQRQLSSELLPKYNLHTVSMATGDGKACRYIREKLYRDSLTGKIM